MGEMADAQLQDAFDHWMTYGCPYCGTTYPSLCPKDCKYTHRPKKRSGRKKKAKHSK